MKSQEKIDRLLKDVPLNDRINLIEVFDTQAKSSMIQYGLEGFKRTFPTLFATIILSMHSVVKRYRTFQP